LTECVGGRCGWFSEGAGTGLVTSSSRTRDNVVSIWMLISSIDDELDRSVHVGNGILHLLLRIIDQALCFFDLRCCQYNVYAPTT
jgi:hypothetical protein